MHPQILVGVGGKREQPNSQYPTLADVWGWNHACLFSSPVVAKMRESLTPAPEDWSIPKDKLYTRRIGEDDAEGSSLVM